MGYNSSTVEENCTSIPLDSDPEELAKKLVESWMKGRVHRANILNNSFKDTGIGIWINRDTAYSSQVFGKGTAKKSKWYNFAGLKAKMGLT